jgi:hypothetical protein
MHLVGIYILEYWLDFFNSVLKWLFVFLYHLGSPQIVICHDHFLNFLLVFALVIILAAGILQYIFLSDPRNWHSAVK